MGSDEEVIKACRMHLRGACGDSLDSMHGSNYQVTIVGIVTLQNFKNRKCPVRAPGAVVFFVRIDPICFLAGCCKRRLNQG